MGWKLTDAIDASIETRVAFCFFVHISPFFSLPIDCLPGYHRHRVYEIHRSRSDKREVSKKEGETKTQIFSNLTTRGNHPSRARKRAREKGTRSGNKVGIIIQRNPYARATPFACCKRYAEVSAGQPVAQTICTNPRYAQCMQSDGGEAE